MARVVAFLAWKWRDMLSNLSFQISTSTMWSIFVFSTIISRKNEHQTLASHTKFQHDVCLFHVSHKKLVCTPWQGLQSLGEHNNKKSLPLPFWQKIWASALEWSAQLVHRDTCFGCHDLLACKSRQKYVFFLPYKRVKYSSFGSGKKETASWLYCLLAYPCMSRGPCRCPSKFSSSFVSIAQHGEVSCALAA